MSLIKRILREPLLHFVAAGILLFIAGRYYRDDNTIYRIVVTPAHVAQLSNQYALQFGKPPDAATLSALVDRDIHDEILFRQGLALKLERNDEIVRRRVAQKMQFLMQDTLAPPEPTDTQLRNWYEEHRSDYISQPRVTFTHIFFTDEGSENQAQARLRASDLLKTLPDTLVRAPDRGDPFPDLYDFSNYEPVQVYRLFGHSDFAEAVYKVTPGEWAGPYRSAYGWHLVYVSSRSPARQAAFDAVRDKVRVAWLKHWQDQANKAAFARVAKQFTVIREDQAK